MASLHSFVMYCKTNKILRGQSLTAFWIRVDSHCSFDLFFLKYIYIKKNNSFLRNEGFQTRMLFSRFFLLLDHLMGSN